MIVQAIKLSENEVVIGDPKGWQVFANLARLGHGDTTDWRDVYHVVQVLGALLCEQAGRTIFNVVHNANDRGFMVVFNP